ncbi:antitoxin VbhA family protein [Planococcus sp. 4-30]|uniref:antitoxin VbhA family protein n=1 Tax=Planococcus sp. 4-30 TaxID=2874583 RepID=UPI001CC0BFC1|nr:antitoxin VbhA family protein [Planococcus sp. 4-30]
MKPVNSNLYEERKKRVEFAVDLAAINGGKPTVYTQNLLEQYETGEITASQVKQAVIEKYTK